MKLDLLVQSFEKCLELWRVNLSVTRTKIMQDIRLIQGDTRKQREVGEIVLNDGIIIEVKSRQGAFVETYGVSKVQFHGSWDGVENIGFEDTRAMGGAGWRRTMGDENPVVKIIGSDGAVIESFHFQCREIFSDVVHQIQDQMKLSAKAPQVTVAPLVTVDLDTMKSILECLKMYVSSWTVGRKPDVSSLIARLEKLVSDVGR